VGAAKDRAESEIQCAAQGNSANACSSKSPFPTTASSTPYHQAGLNTALSMLLCGTAG